MHLQCTLVLWWGGLLPVILMGVSVLKAFALIQEGSYNSI